MKYKYTSYKSAGCLWLDRVPSHWRVEKLKFVANAQASNVDKHSVENEQPVRLCNYTDVYNNDCVTSDLRFMDATATAEEIAKFSLRAGDVVITKDSESWQDIAVPAYVPECLEGVLCGYHLSQIRPNPRELRGDYLFRLLQSMTINRQFQVNSNGVTRFGLPGYHIDNAMMLVPPLDEQRAIARFLDARTAQIDELIAKKRRLLKLLAEQRKALITRAVTKGLNPDAPMKDSGVPWIGEIPAHWNIRRLDRINDPMRRIMYGIVLPGPNVEDGVSIIKGGDVRPGRLTRPALARTTYEIDTEHARSRVRNGDIVYSIRGSFGEVAVVPADLDGVNITQDTARIAPTDEFCVLWLLHVLTAESTRQQLCSRALGATISGINIRDLKRALLPIPPRNEQEAIASFIGTRLSLINTLHQSVLRHIELLREMRSATITAAVTGQIDVRGWQSEKTAQDLVTAAAGAGTC